MRAPLSQNPLHSPKGPKLQSSSKVTEIGGSQKEVSKRWFWRMFPGPTKAERGYKKRNDSTKKQNKGTKRNDSAKTGTWAHAPKPPFCKTTLFFPLHEKGLGQNRQSPIASVRRTRSTLASHSTVPRRTNDTRMNANCAIRFGIAAQRTQGLRAPISVFWGEM